MAIISEKLVIGWKTIGLFLLMIILLFSSGTVPVGERGVLLQFNAVTGKILGEGLYFKIPFVQKVRKLDIKVQKEQTEADAASRDLQTVKLMIALNFHLQADKVAKIWQEIGKDYKTKIIDPAIQESVKASIAQYTAEELITKREIMRETIKELLKEKLEPKGIVIDEFNIINFDFSFSFKQAIEMKVTTEQNALAAKNKLEQIKFEAQQVIEAAQGKAKAIQIEGEALKNNPNVTELRWIEKWNGQVPTFWGQANPFIGINK